MTTKQITHIEVRSLPDANGKVSCFVDGYLEDLTPAKIRKAAEHGTNVTATPEVAKLLTEVIA